MNVQEPGQTLARDVERPDINDEEEIMRANAMQSAEDLNQRE